MLVHLCMHAHVCVCVCISVCMCICMYACVYICMYVGTRCSSWCDESLDRSFMVDTMSYFSLLHDWCNKGCGMCYPVCGMMHIKEPLVLIRKSSPCGGSGYPLLLS